VRTCLQYTTADSILVCVDVSASSYPPCSNQNHATKWGVLMYRIPAGHPFLLPACGKSLQRYVVFCIEVFTPLLHLALPALEHQVNIKGTGVMINQWIPEMLRKAHGGTHDTTRRRRRREYDHEATTRACSDVRPAMCSCGGGCIIVAFLPCVRDLCGTRGSSAPRYRCAFRARLPLLSTVAPYTLNFSTLNHVTSPAQHHTIAYTTRLTF
jgi:hypothetical protein